MEKALQVFTLGDFDMPYTVALCTDKVIAEKLIRKHANRWKKVNIECVEPDKFKVKEISNGEPYDYWIKEVKLNTLI